MKLKDLVNMMTIFSKERTYYLPQELTEFKEFIKDEVSFYEDSLNKGYVCSWYHQKWNNIEGYKKIVRDWEQYLQEEKETHNPKNVEYEFNLAVNKFYKVKFRNRIVKLKLLNFYPYTSDGQNVFEDEDGLIYLIRMNDIEIMYPVKEDK